MANLVKGDSWSGITSQTKKEVTYTFPTNGMFLDKNIDLNVNVPGINLENTQTFYINDGINIWNWAVDGDGNVLIT